MGRKLGDNTTVTKVAAIFVSKEPHKEVKFNIKIRFDKKNLCSDYIESTTTKVLASCQNSQGLTSVKAVTLQSVVQICCIKHMHMHLTDGAKGYCTNVLISST